MSLCFFVPAEQGGAAEEPEQEASEDPGSDSQQSLQQFWAQVTADIRKVTAEDFKTQALPLARIKKIMKLDEEVKMISAEAPVLFAKAAEIFIHELTLRAWSHTEDNKRRTLQRNDIAMAISKSDMFDFLIDIVPRHEVKPTTSVPRADTSRASTSTTSDMGGSSSQCTATVQSPAQQQPQFVIQQQIGQQQIVQGSSSQAVAPPGGAVVQAQQPVTLLQQVMTTGGEMQQVPIQLSAAQLNLIRLQVQANPNQPIIIQAAPQHHPSQPQIIQVSSQAPHQGQQQVYHLQVANQED